MTDEPTNNYGPESLAKDIALATSLALQQAHQLVHALLAESSAENGQLYLKPPRRLTLVYGEQTGKINVAVSPEPLACVLTPLAYQLSGGASVLP